MYILIAHVKQALKIIMIMPTVEGIPSQESDLLVEETKETVEMKTHSIIVF